MNKLLLTITTGSLALMMHSISANAQGLQPNAAVNQGTNTFTAAPSTTLGNRAPRIEGIQGQQLLEAEAIVRAARGECRRLENAADTPTTPEGRVHRSTVYKTCMAQKEAGNFVAQPVNQGGTAINPTTGTNQR